MNAIDLGGDLDDPGRRGPQGIGHMPAQAQALLPRHQRMAHQDGGVAIVFQPEQAHAAARGHAFGGKAGQHSVTLQGHLELAASLGIGSAPAQRQFPAFARRAGQFRLPLAGRGGFCRRWPVWQGSDVERQAQCPHQGLLLSGQGEHAGRHLRQAGLRQPKGLFQLGGQAPDLPLGLGLGPVEGRFTLHPQESCGQRQQGQDGRGRQGAQPAAARQVDDRTASGGGRLAGRGGAGFGIGRHQGGDGLVTGERCPV